MSFTFCFLSSTLKTAELPALNLGLREAGASRGMGVWCAVCVCLPLPISLRLPPSLLTSLRRDSVRQ